MGRLTILGLACLGVTTLAGDFPNPRSNAVEKAIIEAYFTFPSFGGNFSETRLWSVPKVSTMGTNDRYPFLLQLDSESSKTFSTDADSKNILTTIFGGTDNDFTKYDVFDAYTAQVYLKYSQVDQVYADASDVAGYNAFRTSKTYPIAHLIVLPYAVRISPIAVSAPTGALQIYCVDTTENSCYGDVVSELNPSVATNQVNLHFAKTVGPAIPVECSDPDGGCTGTYTLQDWKTGFTQFDVTGTTSKGTDRETVVFTDINLEQLQTIQLLLITTFSVAYVSTTPVAEKLVQSAVQKVQGGGSMGHCTMMVDHNIDGNDYLVGLIDTGVDQESSFFVDPNDVTPCTSVAGLKVTPCNGREVSNAAFEKATKVQVGGVDYYNEPDARKITSIVVGNGADGASATAHGTSVASVINGFPYKGKQYAQCDAATERHVGIAPAAKISVYDVGDSTDKIVLPDENYGKIFSVAKALNAKDFVVPFGGNSHGQYTPLAADIDRFMHENSGTLVVTAAGNVGTTGSHIASAAVSKNAIAVGALNGAFSAPWAGNAQGPTAAGLVKPDIIAPGVSITTAQGGPNNVMAHCKTHQATGSSISAGFVAGASVLVRQYFEQGFYPSGEKNDADAMKDLDAATIKAVLVNGARQQPLVVTKSGRKCSTTDRSGHGSIQLDQVLTFADNKAFDMTVEQKVANPTDAEIVYEKVISVEDSFVPVSATLAWIDPPAANGARHPVVQDLHLEIATSDGGLYTPQGHEDCHVVEHAFTSQFTKNTQNTQKVVILNPKKDVQYTVRVRKTFVFEQQKFSVVVTAGTVKEGEQKTRLCCPEGSYPTYAGCFYIEYIFLTIIVVAICAGVIAVFVCMCIKSRQAKKEREAEGEESEQ